MFEMVFMRLQARILAPSSQIFQLIQVAIKPLRLARQCHKTIPIVQFCTDLFASHTRRDPALALSTHLFLKSSNTTSLIMIFMLVRVVKLVVSKVCGCFVDSKEEKDDVVIKPEADAAAADGAAVAKS